MNATMLILDEPDPQPPAIRTQVVELVRSGALGRTVRWQPLLGTFGFVVLVLTFLGGMYALPTKRCWFFA
jgi:hypothetical protein